VIKHWQWLQQRRHKMMDPAMLDSFSVVVMALSALIILGVVGLIFKLMTRPVVLFAAFGLLGWLLYMNTI